jgi:hypothetical protein
MNLIMYALASAGTLGPFTVPALLIVFAMIGVVVGELLSNEEVDEFPAIIKQEKESTNWGFYEDSACVDNCVLSWRPKAKEEIKL